MPKEKPENPSKPPKRVRTPNTIIVVSLPYSKFPGGDADKIDEMFLSQFFRYGRNASRNISFVRDKSVSRDAKHMVVTIKIRENPDTLVFLEALARVAFPDATDIVAYVEKPKKRTKKQPREAL